MRAANISKLSIESRARIPSSFDLHWQATCLLCFSLLRANFVLCAFLGIGVCMARAVLQLLLPCAADTPRSLMCACLSTLSSVSSLEWVIPRQWASIRTHVYWE